LKQTDQLVISIKSLADGAGHTLENALDAWPGSMGSNLKTFICFISTVHGKLRRRFADRAGVGKIVVTAAIPLAARCVKAGAFVLAPDGKIFDDASIGMALAMRNLMEDLRSSGAVSGGPKGFSPRDRSAFLSALERCVQQARKRAPRES
jgi:uncharacterized protein YaiI (UPF0178 family)